MVCQPCENLAEVPLLHPGIFLHIRLPHYVSTSILLRKMIGVPGVRSHLNNALVPSVHEESLLWFHRHHGIVPGNPHTGQPLAVVGGMKCTPIRVQYVRCRLRH